VERYKNRDKTLGRLHSGLEDLTTILSLLKEAVDKETPVLTLLKGPVLRLRVLS
jgi:Fungal N-terminal domain of STAND proteins